MNNTFNIQRFGLLLKRQWLEFGKIYLISLLVALGVIITFYGLALWKNIVGTHAFSERDLHFREPLFLIFGFIFISIIASNYFAHLGQKPKAIIDLLIPASTFEKFLTGIFFTSILAIASFVILFYLTDLAFVSKLRSLYHSVSSVTTYTDASGKEVKSIDNIMYFFSKNSPNLFKPLYAVPFFVTSIFLVGSIYFNKFHYIKTAISVMIFSGIWSLIIFKSGEFLFEGKVLIESEEMPLNNVSRSDGEILGVLLLVVLTAIFWSITYVRLKEKEV
ncbi:hypothetical protein FA048_04900 [Pedobacter polaris]|uniref:Uncharacterized protein n=1 Tax=Pedobacter polaris TaxID=2571273 RepID=A0A4U1CZ11_9SPHI|nr:hypothetical protein [Pedobacter polaris]TKC12959.1 hypothetical protein FA048_04900 [Pedobacter polaris]